MENGRHHASLGGSIRGCILQPVTLRRVCLSTWLTGRSTRRDSGSVACLCSELQLLGRWRGLVLLQMRASLEPSPRYHVYGERHVVKEREGKSVPGRKTPGRRGHVGRGSCGHPTRARVRAPSCVGSRRPSRRSERGRTLSGPLGRRTTLPNGYSGPPRGVP